MTRDELYALIADHVAVNDGLDYENGQAFYEPYVSGIDDATDAILAKLESEQKAKDYNPEAILKLIGVIQ